MRLLMLAMLALCFVIALPLRADDLPSAVSAAGDTQGVITEARPTAELAQTSTAETRPDDALDSVVLADGEVVRGVVRFTGDGVAIRLRSGEERAIPRAEIRQVNRWEPAPKPAPKLAAIPDAPKPSFSTQETVWYGWQNVSVDLFAVAMGTGALLSSGRSSNTGPEVLGYAGLATYLFGSPILHAFHQDSLKTSIASFALRAGLPIVSGMVGMLVSLPSQRSCDAEPEEDKGDLGCLQTAAGFLLGAGVGIITAIALDDGLLAREPVVEAPRVSLAPMVLPRGAAIAPQGGTGVSFAARF